MKVALRMIDGNETLPFELPEYGDCPLGAILFDEVEHEELEEGEGVILRWKMEAYYFPNERLFYCQGLNAIVNIDIGPYDYWEWDEPTWFELTIDNDIWPDKLWEYFGGGIIDPRIKYSMQHLSIHDCIVEFGKRNKLNDLRRLIKLEKERLSQLLQYPDRKHWYPRINEILGNLKEEEIESFINGLEISQVVEILKSN